MKVTITNHQDCVYRCEGVVAKPGEFEYDLTEETLARFLAHESVTYRVTLGLIEIEGEDLKIKRPSQAETIDTIKKATDVLALERIADVSPRGPIRNAAKNRLQQVREKIAAREQNLIQGDGVATAPVTVT